MKANIVWRLLIPIMLALLLVVGFITAIFIAGVAIALFIVGLTILPLSAWIGPVLLLFSLSGMMLAACLFLLVPEADSERWIRLLSSCCTQRGVTLRQLVENNLEWSSILFVILNLSGCRKKVTAMLRSQFFSHGFSA